MADLNVNRTVVGAQQVAAEFDALAGLVGVRAAAVTQHHGQLLLTRVRAKASGRPGPRARTGDYRRSISLEFGISGSTVAAEVGTNAPQGRRLEWGFWDMTDSLGRHFFQPPYPHFGPAVDEIDPLFVDALAAIVPGDPA